jgi:hypothetical protein
VEGKTILVETWLMQVERRMCFLVIENSRTRNDISASYVPQTSSMQLHTFMLGIDVARRALLVIFIPPFRSELAARRSMRQR